MDLPNHQNLNGDGIDETIIEKPHNSDPFKSLSIRTAKAFQNCLEAEIEI